MLYDVRITAEQIMAVAKWSCPTEAGGADIALLVDDRMLIAEQGDDRMAWDTGGEPASEEYLALCPLYREPSA